MKRRKERVDLGGASHFRGDAVVVVDGIEGGDELVVPAVIDDQFAAVPEVGSEIRVGGADQILIELVREGDVLVESRVRKFQLGLLKTTC